MAQKPTDLPEWASDPGADIETPPPGKQATGWQALEKPPHQWFNWFFNLVYRWTAFLQDYAANHVHDGGSTDLSAPKIDPNSEIDWSSEVTGQDVKIGGATIDSAGGVDAPSSIRALTSGTVFSRLDPTGVATFSERVQVGYPIKARIRGSDGFVEAPNAPKIVTDIGKGGSPGSYSIGVTGIGSPNAGEYQIHPAEPLTTSACVIVATVKSTAGDPASSYDVIIATDVTPDGSGGYYPTIRMYDSSFDPVEVALNVAVYY